MRLFRKHLQSQMESVDKGLARGGHGYLHPIPPDAAPAGGPSRGRAPPGGLRALAPRGVKLGRPRVAAALRAPPSPGPNPQARWSARSEPWGAPPPPRPAGPCRRGARGPESAAACPGSHCERRVALASGLESSPWVGSRRGGRGWAPPPEAALPDAASSRQGAPGQPGPSTPASSWAGPGS